MTKTGKVRTVPKIYERRLWMMKPLTEVYGRESDETTPGKLLTGLIRRAMMEKTGRQVAVIIDEYDAHCLTFYIPSSRSMPCAK